MRWSYNLERSYSTAVWLFTVAAFVVLMVVVGGATRLTGSGLSIVEWRPITGVLPPFSQAAWTTEFAKYQHIPQYKLVNLGMGLGQFKTLYWWEWAHRLIGRMIGVVFLVPFVGLLIAGRVPKRLIWRCAVIFGLGGLQGFIGWWMVSSGLDKNVLVAPERLAVHLGLALLILIACVWTGLEAWFGRARPGGHVAERVWMAAAIGLVVLVFFQIMLGALVAGNQAGRIYTDWPLMDGRFFPAAYALRGEGAWKVLAHSQAAVQFNHRMVAYLLLAAVVVYFIALAKAHAPERPKALSLYLMGAVMLQAMLGILTLRMATPLWLGLLHQLGAAGVLSLAVMLAWRIRRA
ncbi:MAG: COX15/CtaA family protein [Pseudomonadota bacterium]|nr:COX15/CtaA family protein [Pseudomonadota bacterium]